VIYVGFSTTNQLISRIIRWFTKATTSHCFFVFDLFGKAWILQSDFFGVVVLPAEKFLKSNTLVAMAPIPELGEQDLARAMEHLGGAYDFGGLLGGIWPVIGRWFKKKWSNPWENPKALFCSEFVVTSLQMSGFPGADKLVASETTPEDLKHFLTEHYLNQEP
jgi:hypothetical protein